MLPVGLGAVVVGLAIFVASFFWTDPVGDFGGRTDRDPAFFANVAGIIMSVFGGLLLFARRHNRLDLRSSLANGGRPVLGVSLDGRSKLALGKAIGRQVHLPGRSALTFTDVDVTVSATSGAYVPVSLPREELDAVRFAVVPLGNTVWPGVRLEFTGDRAVEIAVLARNGLSVKWSEAMVEEFAAELGMLKSSDT